MKCWLACLVHGSRDPNWRAPIEALVGGMSNEQVRLAYMEYAAPSLLDVAQQAVVQGVTHLRVWPLFMSGGGHVDHDIPKLAEVVRQTLPTLHVEVLPPLGTHPKFIELVQTLAQEFVK